jgi:muramoyltetrapeptide carboxypeptidase
MWTRRQIITVLSSALTASFAHLAWASSDEARKTISSPAKRVSRSKSRALIKPPRLKNGDLVALFAPGGHVTDEQIERGVKNVESLGLRVKLSSKLRERYGGYAGRPQSRADDLHELIRDREVKALWSIRGGSGTAQILPLLDYESIRAHPKIIIGFSDITALVNAVTHLAGVVTFHGPGAISTFSDYSKNHLQSVLFDGVSNYVMRSAQANDERAATEPEYALKTLRAGIAEGPLWGGNLSVFSAMIGTPFLPSFKNAMLFIEEVGEEPYRIDRMLTHLRQHIGDDLPVATLFGVFRRYAPKDDAPTITLPQVIDDHCAAQPIPCVSGYSFGHISHQMTLPIGVRARVDTRDSTLTLMEAAVI